MSIFKADELVTLIKKSDPEIVRNILEEIKTDGLYQEPNSNRAQLSVIASTALGDKPDSPITLISAIDTYAGGNYRLRTITYELFLEKFKNKIKSATTSGGRRKSRRKSRKSKKTRRARCVRKN
jgi:hypothetical protein